MKRYDMKLAITIALTTATALGQDAVPAANNFVHPPGTVTAPLGELGHVEKRGREPVAIVLIPGAAFGWTVWESFMARNADRYTMYAITPPGYDGTQPPPMPPGEDFTDPVWTKALCDGIVRLIDRDKLDRPFLVGHHMLGDHYAMRIALEHPEKTRGVIVIAGSAAMPMPGAGNKPGDPVKFATLEERKKSVYGFFVPFYRTVSQSMWRSGSFPARIFCRDPKRGAELFEQQVAVPLPTQLRYFLEYMVTDLSLELPNLKVPMLVVQSSETVDLDTQVERYREMNIAFSGTLEKAKESWEQRLRFMWGDVETGAKWSFNPQTMWERLRSQISDFRIEYVDDTGVFVMEDQPEKLDAIVAGFAKRVAGR